MLTHRPGFRPSEHLDLTSALTSALTSTRRASPLKFRRFLNQPAGLSDLCTRNGVTLDCTGLGLGEVPRDIPTDIVYL